MKILEEVQELIKEGNGKSLNEKAFKIFGVNAKLLDKQINAFLDDPQESKIKKLQTVVAKILAEAVKWNQTVIDKMKDELKKYAIAIDTVDRDDYLSRELAGNAQKYIPSTERLLKYAEIETPKLKALSGITKSGISVDDFVEKLREFRPHFLKSHLFDNTRF